MKIYNLKIIDKNFSENESEQNSENRYVFQIEYKYFFPTNKMEASEFKKTVDDMFVSYDSDTAKILEKLSVRGENTKTGSRETTKIWQNEYKDLIVSCRSSFTFNEDVNEFLRILNEIKTDLLNDQIYLKIFNYIN